MPYAAPSRILEIVDEASHGGQDAGASGALAKPTPGTMVTANVRLKEKLGAGGMGSLWIAEHLALKTEVVVKFMGADLAASPEAASRFSREAAAASQVKSPHVVQIFDHGVTEASVPYIVMELLEGRDLAKHLDEKKRLLPTEVVAIVIQLARALVRAHEKGIVHRDIKPNNVFLCDAGGGELFVKLLDFGIAKVDNVALLGQSTRTGSFVGSPFYMSPEQVVGAKDVDFRTDLWSLGVVAYEALTGEKPFMAETVGGLALKIHRDPLPVPSRANLALPASIDAWFSRACAREPKERFASAREMAEALAVAVTGERPTPQVLVDSRPTGASPVSAALGSSRDGVAGVSTGTGEVPVVPRAARAGWTTSVVRMLVAFGIGVAAVGVGLLAPRVLHVTGSPATAPAPSQSPTMTVMSTTTTTTLQSPSPSTSTTSSSSPSTTTSTSPPRRPPPPRPAVASPPRAPPKPAPVSDEPVLK